MTATILKSSLNAIFYCLRTFVYLYKQFFVSEISCNLEASDFCTLLGLIFCCYLVLKTNQKHRLKSADQKLGN